MRSFDYESCRLHFLFRSRAQQLTCGVGILKLISKTRVSYFGILIIRILLFSVLYQGLLVKLVGLDLGLRGGSLVGR